MYVGPAVGFLRIESCNSEAVDISGMYLEYVNIK